MMATSQSYHDYVLDQFRLAEGISTRKMMGEYVLYVQGRVMGGLYDDRLMVKPTAAARALLRIRDILADDALSDETCFAKIEAIVSLLEELGVDCGSRHDFG